MQLDFVDFDVPASTDGSCGDSVEIRAWYPETPGVEYELLIHVQCRSIIIVFLQRTDIFSETNT